MLKGPVATAFYGKFRELRPAQNAAIRPLLEGRNVVIASGTGSGKTEAAAAPLISRHMRTAFESDSVTLLYVAPTRALVNDLFRRLSLPLGALGLRLGIRHGERDDLKSGLPPHVLITTPESLDVMLMRGDTALESVHAVVIDEVHLLYNTQRGLHLSVLLRRLSSRLGRSLQWAALSATVGNLRDVVDFLFNPAEKADLLDYPSGRPIDAIIRRVATPGQLSRLITAAVVDRRSKVLLFADSRRECERLVGLLTAGQGIGVPVFTHYSSLARDVREKTEADFASASGAVCVATSTLELGIDIGDIDLVALWGAPASVESFLQRIGRGNRRTHTSNVACLIPDQADHVVREAVTFLALLDAARCGDLPRRSPYKLYGAFAQQSLSRIAAANGAFTRLADLLEPVAPCGYCDRDRLEEVMDELAEADFVKRHDFYRRYGASEGLWQLVDYRIIYGNFPVSAGTVEMRHAGRVLGDVPAVNLMRLKCGEVVRFSGRAWTVKSTRADCVELEPAGRSPTTVELKYGGGCAGLDVFVADRAWDVLSTGRWDAAALAQPLRDQVANLATLVGAWSSAAEVPYVRRDGQYRYFTFAGKIINRTIAHSFGADPSAAGDLTLSSLEPLDFSILPDVPQPLLDSLDAVFEGTSDRSVYQGMLPGRLQIEEFRQPWLRDRTIPKVLDRLRASRGAEAVNGVGGIE